MAKGYRDKVLVATKYPFLVHSRKDMDAILNKSLERLKTDYIDYYLIHSLTGKSGWDRAKGLGMEEF